MRLSSPVFRIDPYAPHSEQVDDDAAIAGPIPPAALCAPPDQQAIGTSEVDRVNTVRDARAMDDERRPSVYVAVPIFRQNGFRPKPAPS